ncbi:sensor histidine kinase [Clostridium felsineum]|uniref:sensor histidine kinase n=1 Tax=Clostridium felsineum TaxID=36839 RepID=UPI001FA86B8E|nr:HAMP domain-containing sensor histidine kinase [Clostridium felsineum]
MSILTILLFLYIVFLQKEIKNINKILTKRLKENTHQPISLALFNKELINLSSNINRCLKVEEELRIESIREEKYFKEMIANISHDLRTPLTAIKGYQQLISKEDLTPSQSKKLKIAQKHTDELSDLIEHFFEYSYLINAKPELKIVSVNLTNLVIECIAGEVTEFEKKSIKVNIEDENQVFAMVDKEMTIRIIQNLIRNCIAHSAGDVTVKVFKKDMAVIIFKNPLENHKEIDIERIFDRFYVGDSLRHKSTGLGLSIVKLLTEEQRGNVGADIQGNMLQIKVSLPV